MADASLDIAEQVARVLRSNAETQKFVEEQRKLSAEMNKLMAEAAKLNRDRMLAPWQIVAASVAATSALIGGTAAVARFFFP
ncbi:hypothetical protein [Methylobacterium platani]|uniref:Uncharacterized protein n=1 Tax=Methylobacterium platani TaxID=427683 RepID=A0A179S6L0_9HYPH|nr:hypothetical protein [Methylobacterium platani]OAS22460.1 hypothetical protein A5481_18860 [Methylobacterium platani]